MGKGGMVGSEVDATYSLLPLGFRFFFLKLCFSLECFFVASSGVTRVFPVKETVEIYGLQIAL